MKTSAKKKSNVVRLKTKKRSTALAVVKQHAPRSIIEVIADAARDKAVDAGKMKELLAMQTEVMARQAKTDFIAAFHNMQMELPVLSPKGQIEIKDKVTQAIIQSTPYAKFADIMDVVKPILDRNGFILRFRTDGVADGRVVVVGILSHRNGYYEESTLTLPIDASGSKNNVQGIGSSTSYGKRYATIALLNLTSRAKPDEDDDGAVGGDASMAPITDEKFKTLEAKIVSSGADRVKFREHFHVDSIRELPQKEFDTAMKMLEQKEARK